MIQKVTHWFVIIGVMISTFCIIPFHLFVLKQHKNSQQLTLLKHSKNNETIKLNSIDFFNLKWVNAKEFIYQNTMYDIINIKKQNNVYILFAKNDKHENKIINVLNTFSKSIQETINNQYNFTWISVLFQSVIINTNSFILIKSVYKNTYFLLFAENVFKPPMI